jgi:hypothetical protein
MPEFAEIAQIHQSGAETPLLVVILAERRHGDSAISSGRNCWRSLEGR